MVFFIYFNLITLKKFNQIRFFNLVSKKIIVLLYIYKKKINKMLSILRSFIIS